MQHLRKSIHPYSSICFGIRANITDTVHTAHKQMCISDKIISIQCLSFCIYFVSFSFRFVFCIRKIRYQQCDFIMYKRVQHRAQHTHTHNKNQTNKQTHKLEKARERVKLKKNRKKFFPRIKYLMQFSEYENMNCVCYVLVLCRALCIVM